MTVFSVKQTGLVVSNEYCMIHIKSGQQHSHSTESSRWEHRSFRWLIMKFCIARDWNILKMFLMAIFWYFISCLMEELANSLTHFLRKYEVTETSTSAWLDLTPFTFESKDKAETFEIQPIALCLQATQTMHSHTHSMTKCGPRQGHHLSLWRLQRPN